MRRSTGSTKPWTRREAEAFLRSWRRSGLTLGAYCKRRGVCAERARLWRVKLEKAGEALELRPVRVIAEPAAPVQDSGFEVTLRGGREIRVPATFDAEALGRLVAVLERA